MGAWWGRARWLIAVGVLLLPVVVVTSALPDGAGFGGGAGERYEQPASAAELAPAYRLGAGTLTVDLRAVELSTGDLRRVEASVGMGELLVIVPATMNVVARGEAGIGEVHLLGMRRAGLGPEAASEQHLAPYGGTLDLRVHVGFGSVHVVHAAVGRPAGPLPGFRLPADPEVF